MAYEYESDVISELEQMGADYQSNEYFNMSIEVEEVYRKAKAYEKLVELYPQKDEIPSDEFFMMMGYIIKELTDDER
ncbi:hypothetical protein PP279_gp33 [Staphylococcus virus IME1354_01]|uniref:Uncharacterized protein n=1 Tax=Staphylococcus virus IME1354_01 TaxID=3070820 RepID=A0A1W6JQ95_9CAUD|nr:hypothetical protein [Staphylococcus ureilyticus]YP_010648357.1 hypothetical protein PP279_gp33 [Staphylococcus virus IME1354_01]ARM68365.1 hypothetical protein [Staphylococcus virus IME1354_01]PIS62226.1 hypothetical protein AZH47_10135 [Corynebacterium striatum]